MGMRTHIPRLFKNLPVDISLRSTNHIRRLTKKEHPISRTLNILKDDIKYGLNRKDRPVTPPKHCDVLIVGGGVMGCSTAFWLKHRALEGLEVCVIEKDPTVMLSNDPYERLQYLQNTSALSVGGLRQQFSLRENIELSLKSAEFLRNINEYLSIDGDPPPDICFNPAGYLFLASESGAHILERNYKLQTELGAKVAFLKADKLKERFPWLNTDGIVAGTFGLENEGWFDPYALLFAFRRKAVYLGAKFLSGEVVSFDHDLQQDVMTASTSDTRQYHYANVKLPDGTEHQIEYSMLVIAAGGLSGKVGEMLGMGFSDGSRSLPLPVVPRKRYVFNVHCPDGPGVSSPLVVDPTGAYVRRDGLCGNYLCGISPPDEEEPPIDNLDVDYDFFEQKVWPIIANRIPGFEKAKLKSAWAGFYDFNYFDENAFVGPHPGYFNVYLATGFSGHGIQQSPMIGKSIMELIVDSDYQTVNLERLHFNRYLRNEPLWESNIV